MISIPYYSDQSPQFWALALRDGQLYKKTAPFCLTLALTGKKQSVPAFVPPQFSDVYPSSLKKGWVTQKPHGPTTVLFVCICTRNNISVSESSQYSYLTLVLVYRIKRKYERKEIPSTICISLFVSFRVYFLERRAWPRQTSSWSMALWLSMPPSSSF